MLNMIDGRFCEVSLIFKIRWMENFLFDFILCCVVDIIMISLM